MADEIVSVQITGDASGAQQAMADARDAVKDGVGGMQEEFEGLGGSLEDIHEKISQAFEVTGIAAAYEAFKKIGEVVDELGERATKIHAFADVLGVSAQEFQAMQVAALEGGTSQEVFARAGERMISMLQQARDGTGAAIEKLKDLGVTTEQINDPTFKLNDLFQLLHDRLTNNATAQDTMNRLIADFGPRAALAAEALKNYDGTAEGVAKVMAKINGLSEETIDALHKQHTAWSELWITVKNYVSAAMAAGSIKFPAAGTGEAGAALTLASDPEKAIAGTQAAAADIRRSSAAASAEITQAAVTLSEITKSEMEHARDAIEQYRQGSEERLAAVREWYNLVVMYYGAETDKAREAHRALAAEERAYRAQLLEQANEAARGQLELDKKVEDASRAAWKAIEKSAAESAQEQEIAQLGAIDRELAKLVEAGNLHQISVQQELTRTQQLLNEKWAAQQDYYNKLRTLYQGDEAQLDRVNKEEEAAHQKHLNEMQKADIKAHAQTIAQWKQLGTSMQTSFASNITAMIEHTKTFGQAIRSIFSTAIDGIIQIFVQMGIQWAENMIMQQVLGKTTAASQITANAGTAATAAMASVAAIPIYGWALAPAVGASTFAEAIAYEASVAERGFDIPAGVNPITQLHQREMVLPEEHADTIRKMGDKGGANKGRTHVTITGIGGGSFLMMHKDQLASALRQLNATFAFR